MEDPYCHNKVFKGYEIQGRGSKVMQKQLLHFLYPTTYNSRYNVTLVIEFKGIEYIMHNGMREITNNY